MSCRSRRVSASSNSSTTALGLGRGCWPLTLPGPLSLSLGLKVQHKPPEESLGPSPSLSHPEGEVRTRSLAPRTGENMCHRVPEISQMEHGGKQLTFFSPTQASKTNIFFATKTQHTSKITFKGKRASPPCLRTRKHGQSPGGCLHKG